MTKTNIETFLMESRGGNRRVCLQSQGNGFAISFGLLQSGLVDMFDHGVERFSRFSMIGWKDGLMAAL